MSVRKEKKKEGEKAKAYPSKYAHRCNPTKKGKFYKNYRGSHDKGVIIEKFWYQLIGEDVHK